MSKMGRNTEIEGVLNKTLQAGPLKPLNPIQTGRGQKNVYCSNCYSLNLYYRKIETGVFDIVCLNCHKHYTKIKNAKNVPKNENKC